MNFLKELSYNNTIVKLKDIIHQIKDGDRMSILTIEEGLEIINYINKTYHKKYRLTAFGTPLLLVVYM